MQLSPRGTQLGVAAFVAFLTDQITKTQEEHGVPPNKHYEIPFVRVYRALPIPRGTQLGVAAFVADFTD